MGGGVGAFNYLKVLIKGVKSLGKGEVRQMVCPWSWEAGAGWVKMEVGEVQTAEQEVRAQGAGEGGAEGDQRLLSRHE